jgi:hypothetical protein
VLDRRSFLLTTLALIATSACGEDSEPAASAGRARAGRRLPPDRRARAGQHDPGGRTEAGGLRDRRRRAVLAARARPATGRLRQAPGPDAVLAGGPRAGPRELRPVRRRDELRAPGRLGARPDPGAEGFATPETLPRFTDVAPTVATSFADWRTNLRQVGQAVGLEEQAAALEAEKDALVAEAKTRLPATAAGLRLNAIAAFDDGSIYVLNEQSPAGKLSRRSGWRRCRSGHRGRGGRPAVRRAAQPGRRRPAAAPALRRRRRHRPPCRRSRCTRTSPSSRPATSST